MTEESTPSAAEAHAERALFQNRILETVAEIREVLEEDLEQFVLRSIRGAFVNDPERSQKMSDERLAQLKADSLREARAQRDRILTALEPEELWLEPGEVEEGAQGLRANARVWRELSRVTEAVETLLSGAGLEGALPSLEYEEPRRFIRSRLLTNLTERYWAAFTDYHRTTECIQHIEREGARSAQANRWDDA
jgi:hypothetical protein